MTSPLASRGPPIRWRTRAPARALAARDRSRAAGIEDRRSRTSTGAAATSPLSASTAGAIRPAGARRPWRAPSNRRRAPCARRGARPRRRCFSTLPIALSRSLAPPSTTGSRPRSHAAEAREDVVDLAGVGAGVEQRARIGAARVVAGDDGEPVQHIGARAAGDERNSGRGGRAGDETCEGARPARPWSPAAHYGLMNVRVNCSPGRSSRGMWPRSPPARSRRRAPPGERPARRPADPRARRRSARGRRPSARCCRGESAWRGDAGRHGRLAPCRIERRHLAALVDRQREQ